MPGICKKIDKIPAPSPIGHLCHATIMMTLAHRATLRKRANKTNLSVPLCCFKFKAVAIYYCFSSLSC